MDRIEAKVNANHEYGASRQEDAGVQKCQKTGGQPKQTRATDICRSISQGLAYWFWG